MSSCSLLPTFSIEGRLVNCQCQFTGKPRWSGRSLTELSHDLIRPRLAWTGCHAKPACSDIFQTIAIHSHWNTSTSHGCFNTNRHSADPLDASMLQRSCSYYTLWTKSARPDDKFTGGTRGPYHQLPSEPQLAYCWLHPATNVSSPNVDSPTVQVRLSVQERRSKL